MDDVEVLSRGGVDRFSRRELQELCKARKIKANGKTVDLKAALQKHCQSACVQGPERPFDSDPEKSAALASRLARLHRRVNDVRDRRDRAPEPVISCVVHGCVVPAPPSAPPTELKLTGGVVMCGGVPLLLQPTGKAPADCSFRDNMVCANCVRENLAMQKDQSIRGVAEPKVYTDENADLKRSVQGFHLHYAHPPHTPHGTAFPCPASFVA